MILTFDSTNWRTLSVFTVKSTIRKYVFFITDFFFLFFYLGITDKYHVVNAAKARSFSL